MIYYSHWHNKNKCQFVLNTIYSHILYHCVLMLFPPMITVHLNSQHLFVLSWENQHVRLCWHATFSICYYRSLIYRSPLLLFSKKVKKFPCEILCFIAQMIFCETQKTKFRNYFHLFIKALHQKRYEASKEKLQFYQKKFIIKNIIYSRKVNL